LPDGSCEWRFFEKISQILADDITILTELSQETSTDGEITLIVLFIIITLILDIYIDEKPTIDDITIMPEQLQEASTDGEIILKVLLYIHYLLL